MSKSQKAAGEVRKALKWIIASGSALTALSAIQTLLGTLQGGEIDFTQFVEGLGYTVAFMVINTAIYYLHEYRQA